MNYIHQLNGFRRWRGQHALSPFAQLLWYSLTVEQNHRLWPERFSISSNDLRQLMGGVGPNTLRHARDELIEADLVEAVVATRGGEVTQFRMIRLYKEESAAVAEPSSDASPDPSANGSKCSETPDSQVPSLLPKPKNLKTLKQQTKPGRCNPDGRTIGDRVEIPAGQATPVGQHTAGSSRTATNWKAEPLYGL